MARKKTNFKKGNNKKSFRRNAKGSSAERDDYDVREDGSGRNDISWYSRNPNLLIAAGSFPYPYRPGMDLELGNAQYVYSATGTTFTGQWKRQFRIPGIMVLDWVPTVGVSNRATDPASIMAKEMYAKVREKYSGSLDADAPDYVIYLMALDSIFSYLAWLKRLYRVMNAWTPENYALPDLVLQGMGLTWTEIQTLRAQRVELWQHINTLILQSRKFTCPAVMDIFNRHYWMSDNVYTDAAEINSQFYMFNPKALFQYKALNMQDGNAGPGLAMVTMPTVGTGNSITADSLYEFGRKMIDALVEWDDAYTINGYLQRAYEGTPNFIVDEISNDQPFNPLYEPEVLVQIENSRVVPYGDTITDFSGFNITQNVLTNAIISNPTYKTTTDVGSILQCGGYTIPPVLSIRSQTPTVADNVIASRLQASVSASDVSSNQGTATFKIDCGSEVPLAWRLLDTTDQRANGSDLLAEGVVHQTPGIVYYDSTLNTDMSGYIKSLMNIMKVGMFDWHPFVFVSAFNGQINGADPAFDIAEVWSGFGINGDLHNVTTVGVEDLENLHRICLYSEFNAFSA